MKNNIVAKIGLSLAAVLAIALVVQTWKSIEGPPRVNLDVQYLDK